SFFFFTLPSVSTIYTLSLPDALPIYTSLGFQLFAFVTATIAKRESRARQDLMRTNAELRATRELLEESSRVNERARMSGDLHDIDRKSTRLNSSHQIISYAVFCLKKK